MGRSHRIAAAATLAALVAGTAYAQAGGTIAMNDLQWREMFPGVSFAPAYGDWEAGAHGKYARIVHGTEVPLHTHSAGYHAVMVSGRMTNMFDGDARAEVGPGDYFTIQAGQLHAHDCVSEEPCLFYTHSDGLWDIAVPEG